MGGLGSPCGGCKFLRRKCVEGCVFAPYFCYEEGSSNFAAIHKVFGASNFSKLISHLPDHDRCDAVRTISYEAHSRLHDPIYGCVSQIFSLQQQVLYFFFGNVYIIFFCFGFIISSVLTSNFTDFVLKVVSLQAQVVLLREEASRRFPQDDPGCNMKQQEKVLAQQMPQDLHNWFHQGILDSDFDPMSGTTRDNERSMDHNESPCSSNESLNYYQEVNFPWSV